MGKNIKKSIELNNIKFSFWILVFKMKNTENLTEEVLRCFLIMDPNPRPLRCERSALPTELRARPLLDNN